jgi:hypothetical protein
MKEDQLIIEFEDKELRVASEYAILPSGRIVVMVEKCGPESYWFHPDGTNPKSRILNWPPKKTSKAVFIDIIKDK